MQSISMQASCASAQLRRSPAPARASRMGVCAPHRARCVSVRAAMDNKPAAPVQKKWPEDVSPAGVPLPPVKPTARGAYFGFVDNAEIINSRAAMIGFFGLIFVELIAGKGFLELIGIETGNGIDIGF